MGNPLSNSSKKKTIYIGLAVVGMIIASVYAYANAFVLERFPRRQTAHDEQSHAPDPGHASGISGNNLAELPPLLTNSSEVLGTNTQDKQSGIPGSEDLKNNKAKSTRLRNKNPNSSRH